jgi:hypothetical protein
MPQRESVFIEDARIFFRNFEGRKREYNAEGERNFCVAIPPKMLKQFEKDGWNIKYSKRKLDEGEEPEAYIEVKVNYDTGRPPRVVLITSRGSEDLGMREVGMIDVADIKTVDVSINPYFWDVNGNKGVKAYLKSIFVTLNEDYLDLKYADIPRLADGVRSLNEVRADEGMEELAG